MAHHRMQLFGRSREEGRGLQERRAKSLCLDQEEHLEGKPQNPSRGNNLHQRKTNNLEPVEYDIILLLRKN